MRCDKVIEALERLAPLSYACEWDNPGLLAGRSGKDVKKLLLALDATDEVIEQAAAEHVDMLITHHPLIFTPIKNVNDTNFIGSRLVKLLQNDISYYAMHTNFDSAPGGMADLAAERLGLVETRVLEYMGESEGGIPYGIGKLGMLPKAMTLKKLAKHVKEAFGLPFVTVYGMERSDEPVGVLAISPGSGKSMIHIAEQSRAGVLITGDIGHHEGIDAAANGLAVIDAGHYGLEHIFVDFMDTYIREEVDGGITVIKAPVKFPAVML